MSRLLVHVFLRIRPLSTTHVVRGVRGSEWREDDATVWRVQLFKNSVYPKESPGDVLPTRGGHAPGEPHTGGALPRVFLARGGRR